MPAPYNLLAIAGSLRTGAFSKAILATLAEAMAARALFVHADIGTLPHFNQDLYAEPLPAAIAQFRNQIAVADGLVISSPEFNHGVPGVLKNALEWASRPHNRSPLKDKPVLIITSSPAFTGGVRAQRELRETLTSALARPVNTPEIIISGVGAKIVNGRFADAAALEFAQNGFTRMFEDIERFALSWPA